MAASRHYQLRPVYSYSLSVFFVGCATWVLWMLFKLTSEHLDVPPRIGLFYLAVALASLFGGRGPGLAALALSTVASLYVLPPGAGFRFESSTDVIFLPLLLFIGVVLVLGIEAIRYNEDLLARTVESRARLRAIMDSAPVALLVADLDGTLRYANREAERIWDSPFTEGGRSGTEEYPIFFPDGTPVPPESRALGRLVAGDTQLPPEERIVEQPDGKRIWTESKGILVRDDAGKPLSALSMFWDITERKRSEHELKLKAEREALSNRIGQVMRGTVDPEKIQAAAVMALGEALKADRCFFIEYDHANDCAAVGQDWRRPDLPSMKGEYRSAEFGGSLSEAYKSGQTLVVDNAEEPAPVSGARLLAQRAMIVVPLFDADLPVASIHAAMVDNPRAWTPDEISLVEMVATETRAAVEAARVRRREHTIASTLQDALLPGLPEYTPRLDLDAYYKAALDESSVGGDFFDVFTVDGATVVVVGDLSGKGLAAAAQVAMVRNMLRYSLYRRSSLAGAVMELNATLVENDLLIGFTTLCVGLFDPSDLTFRYVSCGHEAGLIHHVATGRFEELLPTGPAIGLSGVATYDERKSQLIPGDLFCLFTDGLTEAGPTRTDLLGVEGVSRIMTEGMDKDSPASKNLMDEEKTPANNARSVIARLIVGVQVHAHGAIRDDVCVLVGVVKENDLRNDAQADDRKAAPPPRLHVSWAHGQDTGQYLLRESLIESERRRLAFNREVLLAVTAGRLLLAEPDELRSHIVGQPVLTRPVTQPVDVGRLRQAMHDMLAARPLPDLRIDDLLTSATEAATNAIKYGKGGVAQLWIGPETASVLISDKGPGISPTNLARATLERGYSTQQTLGMGFALILGMVDTVILSTSSDGTQILLTVGCNPRRQLADELGRGDIS